MQIKGIWGRERELLIRWLEFKISSEEGEHQAARQSRRKSKDDFYLLRYLAKTWTWVVLTLGFGQLSRKSSRKWEKNMYQNTCHIRLCKRSHGPRSTRWQYVNVELTMNDLVLIPEQRHCLDYYWSLFFSLFNEDFFFFLPRAKNIKRSTLLKSLPTIRLQSR